MRLGVIGINHKLAGVHLREVLAKACERRFGLGSALLTQGTFLPLLTCNRTEIYFSGDLAKTHSDILLMLRSEVSGCFDQKLYSYFGLDCFHHLSRVTAGLDSAIIGETEIQGQVKKMYEQHKAHYRLPSDVHFAFQKALKIGKTIRRELGLHEIGSGLESVVCDTIKKKVGRAASVVVIGASEVNDSVIRKLVSKGGYDVTLCNRTWDRGEAMARAHDIAQISWDERDTWSRYDVAIFGTKSPTQLAHPVAGAECQLVFDLSVPRNVNPDLGCQLTLYNIDQIDKLCEGKRRLQATVVAAASALCAKGVERQLVTPLQRQIFSVA